MQSVRQYRALGRRVQEQLDRKQRTNSQTGEPHSDNAVPTSPATQPAPAAASSSDVEKADTTPDNRESWGNTTEDTTEDSLAEQKRPQTELGQAQEQQQEQQPGTTDAAGAVPPSTQKPLSTLPSIPAGRSLSRTTTKSQQSVGSSGTMLVYKIGIDVRDQTSQEGEEKADKVFVVGFEGPDDPLNPHNWPLWSRWLGMAPIVLIGAIVGFASSIDASVIPNAAAEFHVSNVAESLATGLFLIGFGMGGLVAGPISETVGRNPVYIVTLALYMIWIMASGLAPNLGAQLTFRFLAGIFAATPLTNAGGSIADLWGPLERIYTFPLFANAAFMGPLFGPVVGGFIAQSSLVSWRWTEWITLILSGAVLMIVVCFQPETFTPILLKWKAEHLRRITGDSRYRGALELRAEGLGLRMVRALYRPFVMTAQEPIIVLIALYLTVMYIVMFGFLIGFEFIYGQTYGLSPGTTGLCFLGIIVGICCASLLIPVIYRWAKRDLQRVRDEGGTRLPPEYRLWTAMLGGAPALPISLFWMGWTAQPSISIASPIIASVFFGFGVLTIFISSYQYLIDSYEIYAASALASVTLLRYVASGAMVVVAVPMYENLGVAHTLTVFACISAACAPLPYVFYFYGHKIRKLSKYAVQHNT